MKWRTLPQWPTYPSGQQRYIHAEKVSELINVNYMRFTCDILWGEMKSVALVCVCVCVPTLQYHIHVKVRWNE